MTGIRTRRATKLVSKCLVAGLVVVTAFTVRTATAAHASSTPSPGNANVPANSGEPVSRLRQEVAAGTLLSTHGVRSVCPRCDAQIVTTSKTSQTPLRAALPAGNGPDSLRAAYALPTTSTSTATIAIIDAGVDGTLASDLATYRKTYGMPACTVANGCLKLVNYTRGKQPAPQRGGAGAMLEEEVAMETSLDMDMASAACASCRLLEISLPWQDGEDDNDVSTADFATAVNTAVAAHASAISISYGYTPDVTNTHGFDVAAFNHKGVPITVSTGDNGFNGGIRQSWPADLPTVIAVGGVTLPAIGKPTAWYFGGSGCETAFPAAIGQPGDVTAACGGHRAASDVSGDADPNTGVAVYDTYAPSTGQPNDWIVGGGTSASAPYIAGLFARAGKLSAVNGPKTLYGAPASDFTDITTGDNEAWQKCSDFRDITATLCNAATGWDGPTGLGMPHGLGAF